MDRLESSLGLQKNHTRRQHLNYGRFDGIAS
jgi:hypothetical protein